MEYWLTIVRAAGDLFSFAAALICLATAIDQHYDRRSRRPDRR